MAGFAPKREWQEMEPFGRSELSYLWEASEVGTASQCLGITSETLPLRAPPNYLRSDTTGPAEESCKDTQEDTTFTTAVVMACAIR
jgi:hypothetical protein